MTEAMLMMTTTYVALESGGAARLPYTVPLGGSKGFVCNTCIDALQRSKHESINDSGHIDVLRPC